MLWCCYQYLMICKRKPDEKAQEKDVDLSSLLLSGAIVPLWFLQINKQKMTFRLLICEPTCSSVHQMLFCPNHQQTALLLRFLLTDSPMQLKSLMLLSDMHCSLDIFLNFSTGAVCENANVALAIFRHFSCQPSSKSFGKCLRKPM